MGNWCYGDLDKPKEDFRLPEDHRCYTMVVAIFHRDLPRVSMLISVGFDMEQPITADLKNWIEIAIEVGYLPTLKLLK